MNNEKKKHEQKQITRQTKSDNKHKSKQTTVELQQLKTLKIARRRKQARSRNIEMQFKRKIITRTFINTYRKKMEIQNLQIKIGTIKLLGKSTNKTNKINTSRNTKKNNTWTHKKHRTQQTNIQRTRNNDNRQQNQT